MTPLAVAQFVLLTTFRADGTGVSTPVWVVSLDGELAVWTPGSSGKVKRIRRNAGVTLAPCDRRGAPLGDPVRGTARLLGESDTRRVRALIRRKYGVLGHILPAVLPMLSGVRRGDGGPVGVSITLDA